jgi:heme-degrading monooxygenase HmoA
MIAVIFEVWPGAERRNQYFSSCRCAASGTERIDVFISIERFESLTEPGKILSLSFWRDDDAVARWRGHAEHRDPQIAGRGGVFRDYRLRVATVLRDYGMHSREDAPPGAVS